MDSVSRINLPADVGQVGAHPVAPEGQPVGQLEDVHVQVLAANDPVAVDDAPVVADAQDPVAPPPGPPIANQAVKPHVPPDPALASEAKGKLVPDKEGLIGLIGKGPKEDTKLFGSFGPTIHRSTHYKAVLGALDAYHALLQNSSGLDPGSLDAAIDGHLGDLEKKCEEYLDAKFAPNKDAMRAFLATVKEQRALIVPATDLLSGLVGVDHDLTLPEVIGLLETHPGITAADVRFLVENDLIGLMRANPGLTVDDLRFAADMGLTFTAVEDKAFAFLETFAKVSDLEAARPEDSARHADPAKLPGKTREFAVFLQSVIGGARSQGVAPDKAAAYFESGVPINAHTVGGGSATGALAPLGRGVVNEVFQGSYLTADGVEIQAVFKPVVMMTYANALTAQQNDMLGIDQENPGYALRNVASAFVDEHLGTGLLVKTELAVVDGRLYVVMEKAKGLGSAKEGDVFTKLNPLIDGMVRLSENGPKLFAELQGWQNLEPMPDGTWKVIAPPGTPELKIGHDYSDPALRLQLTQLQWLDALTGQVDRHGKNYLVERDADGKQTLKGIDNDMAFGNLQKDVATPIQNRPSLPEVIDAETAAKLKQLHDDPTALIASLEGVLPQGDIDAMVERLQAIYDKIIELEGSGGVIGDVNDWGPRADGTDPVGAKLGVVARFDGGREQSFIDQNKTRDASYVARDDFEQKAARAKGQFIDYDMVA